VTCRPAGASSREFSDRHGVSRGAATSVAPAATRSSVAFAGVGHLEGDAHPDARPPLGLDPVDHRHLRRVRQLERRPAGVEDHHARVALALERRLLGEAERVAVESDRGLEVVCLHDQAQLANGGGSRRVIAHASPYGRPPEPRTPSRPSPKTKDIGAESVPKHGFAPVGARMSFVLGESGGERSPAAHLRATGGTRCAPTV